MNYEVRTTCISVLPKNQPLYSEFATEVCITDDSGGEYVEVSQVGRTDLGKIAIDPSEWHVLRDAIDSLIAQCREKDE